MKNKIFLLSIPFIIFANQPKLIKPSDFCKNKECEELVKKENKRRVMVFKINNIVNKNGSQSEILKMILTSHLKNPIYYRLSLIFNKKIPDNIKTKHEKLNILYNTLLSSDNKFSKMFYKIKNLKPNDINLYKTTLDQFPNVLKDDLKIIFYNNLFQNKKIKEDNKIAFLKKRILIEKNPYIKLIIAKEIRSKDSSFPLEKISKDFENYNINILKDFTSYNINI